MEVVCRHCSKPFESRKDALYCSDACRKAYKRTISIPNSGPQLQLEQVKQELEASQYKIGVVREMIDEFVKDYPQFREIITEEYFGRIIKRRHSQGEAQQLEKYFGYRPDGGQRADK